MAGTPEAAIASAVIRVAILEANGRFAGRTLTAAQCKAEMAGARAFLRPDSPDLAFWCWVADLDPVAIAAAAKKNGAAYTKSFRRSRSTEIVGG